jgi:Uma2 family endonuclease
VGITKEVSMTWQQVIQDQSLQNLPYKIELNEQGKIVMSPATNIHGILQMHIGSLLMQLLGGTSIAECSIQTSKNVKVADVAWMSAEFSKTHKHQTPFLVAPEICVEIFSPSNSQEEMLEKRELYFERGAKEVWVCDLKGNIQFYNPDGRLENSQMVEGFPHKLEI